MVSNKKKALNESKLNSLATILRTDYKLMDLIRDNLVFINTKQQLKCQI
jgi:hypothetical protein